MIRHCVFLHFRPEVTVGERDVMLGEIAALKGPLPGLLAMHIGGSVSTEKDMGKRFTDGCIVDFRDAAAPEAFLVDPEHQATGRELVAAAEGGVGGILVYDLEIAGG